MERAAAGLRELEEEKLPGTLGFCQHICALFIPSQRTQQGLGEKSLVFEGPKKC
jgi:hypothetical protein